MVPIVLILLNQNNIDIIENESIAANFRKKLILIRIVFFKDQQRSVSSFLYTKDRSMLLIDTICNILFILKLILFILVRASGLIELV